MTPTTIPGLVEHPDSPRLRARRVLRLLTLRANQPANPGVDRAIVKAAARTLIGHDAYYYANQEHR